MVVDVLVRPLRWVARAATGLAFAAAVILGAGLTAPAPAAASSAPQATVAASASAPAAVDAAVDAGAPAGAPPVRVEDGVDVPVTRPGDRVAVDRWQRPAPGQRGPPSGE